MRGTTMIQVTLTETAANKVKELIQRNDQETGQPLGTPEDTYLLIDAPCAERAVQRLLNQDGILVHHGQGEPSGDPGPGEGDLSTSETSKGVVVADCCLGEQGSSRSERETASNESHP